MSKIVRISADTPISEESVRELEELAKMPDSEIDTVDIPERRFGQSKRVAFLPTGNSLPDRRKAG